MPDPNTLFRLTALLIGLLAIWAGCDMANAPLQMGGPMTMSLNPLGVPLVALGIAGVAFAPARAWTAAWLLAAGLSLVAAGTNLWQAVPIGDGAFQSLRAGVPDPDIWPAPALLHAVAFAPAGVALAALRPGPRRAVPLLLASVAAVIGSGFGLEAFAEVVTGHGTTAWPAAGAIAAPGLLALFAAWSRHPVGRAVAGQAAVLTALCAVLWAEYARAL